LAPVSAQPALGRALAATVLAVGAGFGGAWLAGAVDAERLPFVALGAVLAVATAAGALFAHRRVFDRRATAALGDDARMQAMRLQSLLGAGFAAKLAVLALVVLLMRAGGLKFPQMAAFAVAFAGASLLAQLTLTGCLVRGLARPAAANSTLSP